MMHHSDPCLDHAYRQWQSPLAQAGDFAAQQHAAAAHAALAEAIRISASFHPLFHFLESGLNTELATLHLRAGAYHEAHRLFARAEFLHHDNATALAGLTAADAKQPDASLPAYDLLALSAPLTPAASRHGIHALLREARAATGQAAIACYEQAIHLCEQVHPAYHRLAALPWLARARLFTAQGENLLARNDIRRGMDLDRENAELLALSLQLAAE